MGFSSSLPPPDQVWMFKSFLRFQGDKVLVTDRKRTTNDEFGKKLKKNKNKNKTK